MEILFLGILLHFLLSNSYWRILQNSLPIIAAGKEIPLLIQYSYASFENVALDSPRSFLVSVGRCDYSSRIAPLACFFELGVM